MNRWTITLALVIGIGSACPGLLMAQYSEEAADVPSGDRPVPAGAMGVRPATAEPGADAAAILERLATADGRADEGAARRALTLEQEEAIRRQERQVRAGKHVETGRALLRERKFAAALKNFEDALALYPRVAATEREVRQTTELAAQASYFLARQLLDEKSFAAARERAQTSLKYVSPYRPAERLLQEIEREEQRDLERRRRGPRVDETPEFRAREERISDNYTRGKELFHFGELDQARARFEAVLTDDPHHRDAKRYLSAIARRNYDSASVMRETVSSDRIADVREAWAPRVRRTRPVIEPDRAPFPQPGEGTELITRKLNELVIPQLEFVDANIQDVVNFLVTTSREIDPEGQGVNILLKLRPTVPPVTGFQEGFPGAGTFPGAPGVPGFEFPGAAPPTGFPGGFPGAAPPTGFPGGVPGAGFPGAGEQPGMFPGMPGGFPGMADTGFPSPFPTEGVFPGQPGMFPQDFATAGVIPVITMNLRDIPLMDAIRYVTEIAGLKFRIESNAVIITPLTDVVTAMVTRIYPVQPTLFRTFFADVTAEQQTTRDRTGTRGGEFVQMDRRAQMVSVAQYSQLVRLMFMEMGIEFPMGSSISYNERISTLIVKNTPENLELLERVLLVLNVIPHQVEIEAKFVEISQTDLEQLALQWFLTDNYEIISRRGAGPLSGRERLQINQDEITSGLRYATDVAGTFGAMDTAGAGFFPIDTLLSFSTVLTNPEFTVLLRALDRQQNTDVLSAPKITTISGSQAQIQVVIELIYPTEYNVTEPTVNDAGTIVTPAVIEPTNFETREVGVILNVTPTVSSDGYTINLALVPEVSELIDWIDYGYTFAGQRIPLNQPIFSSRNATTNLIIYDGQTVVLGGLITEQISKLRDKVPILGDIPIFGRLFRSEVEFSTKRNLLIFTTARLVDPAGRPIHAMEDVTDFVRRPMALTGGGLIPPGGLPAMPAAATPMPLDY